MLNFLRKRNQENRRFTMPEGLSREEQKAVKEIIKSARRNDEVPHTAQQSIPFDRMFPDGICRVGLDFYTKTVQFQDINYQLAQQEDKTEIFEEWCAFLNFFDSSVKFQLSFENMATDVSDFEKSIKISHKNDGFDDVRDVENDNHNLRNVIGNLWTELREKEDQLAVNVISDFRRKTIEQFHPVDGMSAGEIEEMVSYYVQAKIIENDLDAQVENVIISGSRCRGIEKNGSDLDLVVDYKGTIREDDFFNILHEDGFTIAGIAVDINPITEDKTGLLAEYLESAEQYLKEKAQERKLEKSSVREKIKQAKRKSHGQKKMNMQKPKKEER